MPPSVSATPSRPAVTRPAVTASSQTASRGQLLRHASTTSSYVRGRAVIHVNSSSVEALISMHKAYADAVSSLTWDEVRSRRLARNHLAARAPAERLVEVVRDVCGIHAQVMGSAELQLAARVAGITQGDVRDALWARRELVKTWTLRGTLHLHPADELGLWTAARRAVVGEADYVADNVEEVDAVVAAI